MQMWWLTLFFIFSYTSLTLSQSDPSLPLLLLVSFDGFRHDYPQLYSPLKNFNRLQQRGVRAQSMVPSFTSQTFPNHYTLITGLYEEVHGLVSNEIFDPQTKLVFQVPNSMNNSRWWPFPTIWTINERRKGGRSGVIGWPQEEALPSKSQPYQRTRPFRDIIDQILRWFNDPIDPINFGAIYYLEPDLTGHRSGPYSVNMSKMVQRCDEDLGYLLDEIDKSDKLRAKLHVIVTSDHGMEQINGTNNPFYLDDYVDMKKIQAYGSDTVLSVFVHKPDDIDNVFANLTEIPHTRVYKRNDIPERFHYKTNRRIGDLLIVLELGYELHRRPSSHDTKTYNLSLIHGNHGYDNELNSMKTIFYASGPQLKENFTLPTIASLFNVDIFGFMCLLLDIDRCPRSNGSLANIQPFLVDPSRVLNRIQENEDKPEDGTMGRVIYLIVLVGFVLILIMAVVWSTVAYRNISALKMQILPGTTTAVVGDHRYTLFPSNNQTRQGNLNTSVGDDKL